MSLTLALRGGLFLVTTGLLAAFAMQVNPRRRLWDAIIGSAYAMAAVFIVYIVLFPLIGRRIAFGVVAAMMAVALYRIGEIGDRRRLARVRKAWRPDGRNSDICLATLPVTPLRVLHPRRETGRCTCQAQRFAKKLLRRRVTLAVSPVALSTWRRSHFRYTPVDEMPLGTVYDVRLARKAYWILNPFRGNATDVDGIRLPAGFTVRLRLTMADRSEVFVSVRSRHNTRLFIELATRVLKDGELRILAALDHDESQDFADLRQATGMPAAKLTMLLRTMAGRGLVDLDGTDDPDTPPASAGITETGLYVLWEKTEDIARVVSPDNDLPI